MTGGPASPPRAGRDRRRDARQPGGLRIGVTLARTLFGAPRGRNPDGDDRQRGTEPTPAPTPIGRRSDRDPGRRRSPRPAPDTRRPAAEPGRPRDPAEPVRARRTTVDGARTVAVTTAIVTTRAGAGLRDAVRSTVRLIAVLPMALRARRGRATPRPTAPTAGGRGSAADRPAHQPSGPAVSPEGPGPPPAPPRRGAGPAHARRGHHHKHSRPRRRHAAPKRPIRRLVALLVAVVIGFVLLVAKVAQLQAVEPDRYTELARTQTVRSEPIPASRGTIADRNGYPLSVSTREASVWADPRAIVGSDAASDGVPPPEPAVIEALARATAEELAPVLGTDVDELTSTILSAHEDERQFVYLERHVSNETAQEVEALDLDGISLLPEPARARPAGDLARSVVGQTDTEDIGVSGIELAYEQMLQGTPGELVIERSRDGYTIPTGEHELIPAVPGTDVTLTLDHRVQYVAEQTLAERVAELDARRGVAIVCDVATGEVLAMASVERQDDGSIVDRGRNIALTEQYDPGSVMKVVTMAAALEEAGFVPETAFNVPLTRRYYTKTFRDPYRYEEGVMSVADILAESSNIGTMIVADQVGPETLDAYVRRFGFGRAPGTGLPGEVPGLLRDLDDWSGTSLPTIAIGQGIGTSPMQVLSAYNAVANDGIYVSPSLVRSTTEPGGTVVPTRPAAGERIIASETADMLTDMLTGVVDHGTGTLAAVDGFTVAGKTGTAWKVVDGGYGAEDDRKYASTFVGFAPAENPQISALVLIDEPGTEVIGGGEAAAPVFSQIMRDALLTLDVPPVAGAEPGEDGKVRAEAATAPVDTTATGPAGDAGGDTAGSGAAGDEGVATPSGSAPEGEPEATADG